jgi:TP901 family phage tail tape measure protein
MTVSLPIVSSFDPKGLNQAKAALEGFASFAGDVLKVAAGAVAAIGAAGLREFAQFETAFAKIEGLVGLSTTEVEQLQKAAKELGPQFGKSANEAADALFFITSAGLRGSSAIDVLEASLKASAAGLGDVTAIANVATASVNTYGESVLTGTQAVDALTEAVRLGQFAPEELASSLGRVIPIAAELGVSFEETTGLVAALTRGGLNASEAVTGVRGAMQAVLKPTGEASDILEKYGLSAEGVRTSIEEDGLLDTFVMLRETVGENEEDFNRLIGSQEGLNAVLALTGANLETNIDIIGQMTDGVGVLDDAFATVADTAQFKFDQAIGNSKNILLGIGEDLRDRIVPYLEKFNTWMTDNAPGIQLAFDNIFGAVENVAGKIEDFVANLAMNESFQEDINLLKEQFILLGDEISLATDDVLGLAETLAPYLTTLITETVIPIFSDFVSIIGDLSFAIDETITIMEELGIQTESVVFDIIERAINPVSRLVDMFNALATALDAARRAWERFKDSNAPLSIDQGGRDRVTNRSRSGGRAAGGPVTGESPYLVGERGPELFVPGMNGRILPNPGGGGSTYNITVNAGMGADPVRVGEYVVSAIKRYERASGKVFASA